MLPVQQFSSFSHLKRVTAWVRRFVDDCHKLKTDHSTSLYLLSTELATSESYWISLIQHEAFAIDFESLTESQPLTKSCRLFSLHPFIDQSGLLRVGGRGQNAQMSFSVKHPVILPGKHPLTSVIIASEHNQLMPAGPTLLTALLSRRYHITNCRKIVCSITHKCVICRRSTIRPTPQLQGQLPAERITPDTVFERVGLDYADPFF